MALFAAVSLLYAADLNIYASGLKVSQTDSTVTIDYVLNTQAESLYFMIYGENINEALIMVETDPAALTKGAHQVVKPTPSNIPAGTYHWAIGAFAGASQFVDALNGDGMYNYYFPQDVAVDNNFNSPFFGRVYVSESTDGASDGMSDATKAQTRGLYMYNADMTFVNGDSLPLHGYDGGMAGDRSKRQGFKRIAIDEAGYVYIASRDASSQGIYRMDPANPTAPFVQIYSAPSTVDAIGIEGAYLYTIEGIGVGAGTLNKYALANPLGNPIATMGQDTILHFGTGDCDAMPDGRGGWWFAENRWNKDAFPCLAHLSARGVCDFVITNDPVNGHAALLTQDHNASYRGVVTVSPDGSMVAMGSDKSAVVFSVSYDESTGVPTLERIFTTPEFGSTIDGVAFDVANNLYIVSASVERLYAFPIPKTNNSFITPAPSASKINIGVPIPVQHMYLIGDNTGWNPTQGIEMTCTADNVFEGVFTFSNDTNYFAFFDALAENNDRGGWDYVNAHRYAGKEDNLLLNHSAWKDSLRLANHTFRIPAGQYKLKVNLNDQVVTVFYQAPAAIPDNALFIAFKDVPGKEGGDNSNRATTVEDIVLVGAELIDSISIIDPSNVYNAREGLGVKLGTTSKTGGFTLHLANAVIPDKIVVNATSYGATEGTAVILGDTVDLAQFGNRVVTPVTKVYDGQTPVSEITIQSAIKRIYVLNVIIIPSPNNSHMCGDNLIWTFANGTLTISGTGAMYNYGWGGCPWNSFKDSIMSVTLDNGITSIGEKAFVDCTGLTSITIPHAITSIGDSAFYGCSGLTSVTMMPITPPTLGFDVFANNASNRVFILNGCSYDNYYTTSTSNRWYEYRNDLRDPTINISINVLPNNPQYGIVGIQRLRDHDVRCDSTAIIYAINNNGYHFDHWSDGITENPRTIILTQDTTFFAEFAINQYDINVSSNETYGHVVGENGSFDYLTTHTYEAIANYGYHFSQWSDSVTDNPRTIVLTQDTSFVAEFAFNQYSINVSCNQIYGHVEGESGAFDYRTVRTYEAIANYGYHFTKWSDGVTSNPRTITITRDQNIEALFGKNSYTIVDGSNRTMGRISGVRQAEYLDSVTLTAIPNYGYHFMQWSDGEMDNPRTIVLTQDTTFVAEFAVDKFGTCGKDNLLRWDFSEDSTLTVSGSGELTENYTYGIEAPTQAKTLVIGNGVAAIGERAFYGFNSLTSVNIYNFETWCMTDFSYRGCPLRTADLYIYGTKPTRIDIPDGITKVGAYAFMNCKQVTEVVLSSTVTEIGEGAFVGGSYLQTITLDDALVTIGDSAFARCPYLLAIHANMAFPPLINNSVFANCGLLSGIDCYVPAGSLALYQKTLVWAEFNLHENETDLKSTQAENNATQTQKVVENGKLYILLPDGTRYDATGKKVE